MDFSSFLVTYDIGGSVFLWNTAKRTRLIVEKSFWENLLKGPFLLNSAVEKLIDADVFVQDRAREARDFKEKTYGQLLGESDHLNITLVPTLDCNLDCKYCFQRGPSKSVRYRGKRWTEELRAKILQIVERAIVKKGIRSISCSVYGGEPILEYDSLINFLHALNEVGEKNDVRTNTRLVTNGTLLNEKRVIALSSAGCSFYLSLDVFEAVGEITRPRKDHSGSLSNALKSIQLCSKYNDTNVNIVLSKELDKEQQTTVVRVIGKIDRSRVTLTLSPEFDYHQQSECSSIDRLVEKTTKSFGLHRALRNTGFSVHCYSDSVCPCLFVNKMIFDPIGRMSKCGALIGYDEFVYSNVDASGEENRIELDSTRFVEKLLESVKKSCEGCSIQPVCMGGCIAENRAVYNMDIPETCDRKKRIDAYCRVQLADLGYYIKTNDSINRSV